MMSDDDDEWTPFDRPVSNVVELPRPQDSDFLGCYALILKLEMPPAAKQVLAAVAFHARGTRGHCWASLNTLARETGLSRSTVKRALSYLLGCALLWRTEAPGRPATYRVMLTLHR